MRYFVAFSYNGAAYHGWQYQPNAISVQEVLETAFTTLLKKDISLMGAGRTDAGVHAKEMYAHFDCDKILEIDGLVRRLNAFLPDDIAVQRITEVVTDAHARFHATERTYEYWVTQTKDPFVTETTHYVRRSLDIDKMNQAAAILLGRQDFECFSKSKTDVNTYLCDVKKAHWEQKDGKFVFTITADRFLRNMVRAIVGTLLDVGTGKKSIADVHTILASKSRAEAGTSVPAKALYLIEVLYPNTIIK
ncbi:tRNA pseudouridine(38-40) synthase TruA [Cellulophaga sp. F20128]|uniref:tRNA pseudouridine(38-40) synthase TruA n=1 Tax=Cellulophaga sp. F20128 TaxID=2926413 RepID=UPI001FF13DCE|nr:tRNA pseudouridine(38-40) synthase TruA [Cellulophaga sp. F20128]MCK0156416.1 tRNA pseudouridine(38-40) synthase TruA [Cellulophaga sp. F20128]